MSRIKARDVAAYLADRIDRHGKAILPGLGTLKLVMRAPKQVRHPKTGALYAISERPALVFRLAKPRKAR